MTSEWETVIVILLVSMHLSTTFPFFVHLSMVTILRIYPHILHSFQKTIKWLGGRNIFRNRKMKMQSVSSHSTFLVLGFPEALCAGTPAI